MRLPEGAYIIIDLIPIPDATAKLIARTNRTSMNAATLEFPTVSKESTKMPSTRDSSIFGVAGSSSASRRIGASRKPSSATALRIALPASTNATAELVDALVIVLNSSKPPTDLAASTKTRSATESATATRITSRPASFPPLPPLGDSIPAPTKSDANLGNARRLDPSNAGTFGKRRSGREAIGSACRSTKFATASKTAKTASTRSTALPAAEAPSYAETEAASPPKNAATESWIVSTTRLASRSPNVPSKDRGNASGSINSLLKRVFSTNRPNASL